MRLTRTHVDYWRARGPAPAWVYQATGRLQGPTIHDCINAHVEPAIGARRDYERQAGNTIAVLRLIRKNQRCAWGAAVRDLYYRSQGVEPAADTRRRARLKKWINRLPVPVLRGEVL